MPINPPDDERSEAAKPNMQAPNPQTGRPNPPLERGRLGGTARRPVRPVDDDARVSRSDLSKGPQELLEHRKVPIN